MNERYMTINWTWLFYIVMLNQFEINYENDRGVWCG